MYFFIQFDFFQYYFLFFALNCFFFGTFGTLFQTKIRKLLAYSTVNTVGFIFLSFSTFSIETIESAIFVLISYIINTSCLFTILIHVKLRSFVEVRTLQQLSDFSFLHGSNSFITFFLVISFFFLAVFLPLFTSFINLFFLQAYCNIII